MRRIHVIVLCGAAFLALAGCAIAPSLQAAAPGDNTARPKPRPASIAPPPQTARTVEQFDTTSAADRAAATEAGADTGAETALGWTVAALGNPAQAGFWLETPLVSKPGPGRVVSVSTGASVALELIPIEGPDGAGSRISLAALRLLGISLTGLHELEVYAR